MKSDIKDEIYITMINYWSWWWQADNKKDELTRSILTIFVPMILLLWYKRTSLLTTHLPPGPYGLPVIGYLPFLGSNLHERFTEMAHKYGPIFSLRLGSKLHVVVNSVEFAKVVGRELDHIFANRDPPVAALTVTYGGLDVMWSNNNKHWRNMRKILVSQVMSNANLEVSKGFRINEVRKTISDIYAKTGAKVDINGVAFDTGVSVVTDILWGSIKSGERNDILDGFREVEKKVVELAGAPNISDFIPMLSRFDLQGRKREMEKQSEYLNRIFDSMIEERIKANSRKKEEGLKEDGMKDFLQIMLELKEQNDASISFDIYKMKALLFNILLASTDTTSTMVEWVMTEILHYPDVMRKVQHELTTVVGINNIVEESHLPKLTYLDAVVKETFRLHPPAPLLVPKCPNESCTVGGYTIPKGSIVYINVWAIHHNPENWKNPLEFKPERFVNEKFDYNGNNMMFLPFGVGRRICPGIPLGEKMLMYMLASLLHSFDWNLPKDEKFDLSDEFGIVTKKRKPLVAIPSPRLSDASLYLYN